MDLKSHLSESTLISHLLYPPTFPLKQHVPRGSSGIHRQAALKHDCMGFWRQTFRGSFVTFLTTSRHFLRADFSDDMSSAFLSATCNVSRSLTSSFLLSKVSIALPLSTAAMTCGSSSDNRLKIARSRKSASSCRLVSVSSCLTACQSKEVDCSMLIRGWDWKSQENDRSRQKRKPDGGPDGKLSTRSVCSGVSGRILDPADSLQKVRWRHICLSKLIILIADHPAL